MDMMKQMMKQAQKMQKDMVKAQEELALEKFSATSGGGMVSCTVNGHRELLEIKIDPECIDPDDAETLEDMVFSAVREAMGKAAAEAEKRLGGLTGGMKMPGLF